MAKILIAEDERDIRDLIEFTLKFAGYEIHKASNGKEAVELAPQIMPDLILLDIRMPQMTGVEACQALKAIEVVKNIPIIFLSAHGQSEEIDTGLAMGAYGYIVKPFAPDDLTKRIREILQEFNIE